MPLHSETLYASEIVTVTDVPCRPHDNCRCAEETTSTNDIVFPRRGCFVRHGGDVRPRPTPTPCSSWASMNRIA